MRTRHVALLSLLCTILFFFEYTPLHRRVHIPFDLEGFHYPLADYAFRVLRAGQFPQWDPTIYSGLSFAGNTQAGLFYPPAWLMFAGSWRHSQLSFQAIEDLALAHVWLAFLLCYIWLRHEWRLHPLAAALGGAVFAFSGFALLQLQHLGFLAGYAWLPLAFNGVDAADRQRHWRPLWKAALASAMCFLAGYPSAWVVFAICVLAYACARRRGVRSLLLAGAALAASFFLSAVQLLPAWEATQLRVKDFKYGGGAGIKEPEFFLSYFVPNYFNFGPNVPINTNPGREYLYLGAAAFAGLGLLLFRRRSRDLLPPLAVLCASLLFLINPFGLAGRVIEQVDLLAEIFSAWYFLAGVTASIALLAALGLDYGLRRPGRRRPLWLTTLAIAGSLAWSIRLLIVWAHDSAFAIGWASALDAIMGVLLLAVLIFAFPGSSMRRRAFAASAALLLVATEYKAFGTSKRFNAARGPGGSDYSKSLPGLDPSLYQAFRKHPEYRLALDVTAPFSTDLRHWNLRTPQGFDPFLPEAYRAFIETAFLFRSNREFDPNPERVETLRLLGVGYFITSENGPLFQRLCSSPSFHRMENRDSYYKVFELDDPQPAFGWEERVAGNAAELKVWRPAHRELVVRSTAGGRFRLSEQFFPGWSARVDHAVVPIERCHGAFQCIPVGEGEHVVEFEYHSRWLVAGAWVSICSLLLLVAAAIVH